MAVRRGHMAYRIRFSPEADDHVAALTARQRAILLDVLGRQLLHKPTVQTRNRKRMQGREQMPIAPWELRIGNLRVYYDVYERPARLVVIGAVGIKVRDRVRIGGKEIVP